MELQDELTEKMHSEFTIDAETDIRHRVGCVWIDVGFDAAKGEIEESAKSYGVTYKDCDKYRSYWKSLHDNRKR